MSKTFKSDNELAKTISITRSQGRVLVEIEDPKHLIAINLSDNNAPALALAVLEAAGWPNEYLATNEILRWLRELDEHVKAMEAEAKDKAELEAEALELFNTARATRDIEPLEWDEVADKDTWVAVARRAREMRNEKKEPTND